MKVQLESTSIIVELIVDGVAIPARIWEGHTETGIPIHCYITRVAVHADLDTTQFERELLEFSAPSPEIQAIPLRLIL